jgi:hypothetical protein
MLVRGAGGLGCKHIYYCRLKTGGEVGDGQALAAFVGIRVVGVHAEVAHGVADRRFQPAEAEVVAFLLQPGAWESKP